MFEYLIAQGEMARRKRAYSTLIASVFLSAVVFSIDFLVSEPLVVFPYLAGFGALLLFSRRCFHKSAEKFGTKRIVVSDTSVKSVSNDVDCEVAFSDVRFMIIKTTVRGTIREIVLGTSDCMRLGLTGIADWN